MKRIFNVDFRKLATLLTPTFLRKPVMLALLSVLMQPLITLYKLFCKTRTQNIYNLTHNGQVCRLKDALNALFGLSYEDGFDIANAISYAQYVWVYDQDQDMPWMLHDTNPAEMIYSKGLIEAIVLPNCFVVWVPRQFELVDEKPTDARIEATVEKYKLLGTTAIYRHKNS